MKYQLDTTKPFTGKSLVGIVFDRLTIESYAGRYVTASGSTFYFWNCRCSCGNKVIARTGDLKGGKQRSCGCLKSEVTTERNTTHGGCDHPIYGNWAAMIQRCRDENQKAHKYYAGKGVCERWNNFALFRDDMLPTWKPGLTLGRIDNEKGYEPGNVRWETWHEQKRNRSDNYFITVNGITKIEADWCYQLGTKPGRVANRIKNGWSEVDAVTIPVRKSACIT
jgi:hypothetical protein